MNSELLKQLLHYRRELFGYIRALVHNTHDADDIFQEVAIVIMEKTGNSLDIRNFQAWVKEIARRKTLEFFRKIRNTRELQMPSQEMEGLINEVYTRYAPTLSDINGEYDALRKCMKKMPQTQRRLLQLRFIADKSYKDITKIIRKTEAAIRRAVARARLVLSDCVQRALQLVRQEK